MAYRFATLVTVLLLAACGGGDDEEQQTELVCREQAGPVRPGDPPLEPVCRQEPVNKP